jgi:uncharacterized protein YndB with AHSA1/START domain
MSREPTGGITREGEHLVLTITREFSAPIGDVWAAVTEPERLERWIGTYTGDPESGRVAFLMTAEGATEPEEMEIRECVPPRVLKLTAHAGDAQWHLELSLDERDGVTTLTFAHRDIDPAAMESVGPGWEYYLDRLVAAETDGAVGGIDFGRDYYPAMEQYYRSQAG